LSRGENDPLIAPGGGALSLSTRGEDYRKVRNWERYCWTQHSAPGGVGTTVFRKWEGGGTGELPFGIGGRRHVEDLAGRRAVCELRHIVAGVTPWGWRIEHGGVRSATPSYRRITLGSLLFGLAGMGEGKTEGSLI